MSRIAGAAAARRSIGTNTLIKKLLERLGELNAVQLSTLLYFANAEYSNRPDQQQLVDLCIDYINDRQNDDSSRQESKP